MKKSIKQTHMEKQVLKKLRGVSHNIAEYMFMDEEILALQDYANIVSIKRLGFNDHGPVHMLKATLNALSMLDLLIDAGIDLNLKSEGIGDNDDSRVVVLIAALLHDIGMTVSRDKHEFMGVNLALPIVNRILENYYSDDMTKRVILRSIILECILGHMATQKIQSLEAGLVLIGDGCDMEQGRARISLKLADIARRGDIHRYSSSAIKKVKIVRGDIRPIKIEVQMVESVGFFQIEEVLYPKIQSSPVKKYIELTAGVIGREMKQYL
ncbi:MAG: HD domain-containing protein [Candidatus Stygibacter australis]|nr:HD domain-containing protein [Candidatus Stygibacter australis]MDP8321029.1 HD domain-containing protein [Candidatus Stygibacter australis]